MGRNPRKTKQQCQTGLSRDQRTTPTGHTGRTALLLVVSVLVVMVAVFYAVCFWSEQNEPTLEPVPAFLARTLNALSMKGNVSAVRSLLDSHPHLDWHSLNTDQSPIHFALRGRFESLSAQAHGLIGRHEVSECHKQ